ncbi:MAG: dihydropteroate synthase [Planctomycetota bacterium]|jgi:dihydropteroate synthase
MADSDILNWPGGRLVFSAGCVAMGVLNVTPDSFSDGGEFLNTDKAVAHGKYMADAGAAIIDVGAESSRPGSQPVSTAEQIERAVGVIGQLAAKVDIPISIDTTDAAVAEAALEAGAAMINDITAFADDDMAALAAQKQVPVVLMHMQGEPATMQAEPKYEDVVAEVLEYLISMAKRAQSFGIAKNMIFIDPGIGFGKTTVHNIELLQNLDRFVASGYRILVGTSRKRFIGELTGRKAPAERIFGTAATVALAAAAGVSIVRVHDIPQMTDVLKIANSIST